MGSAAWCLIGWLCAPLSFAGEVRVSGTHKIPGIAPSNFDLFGSALASVTDLDGDGLGELVVGTPRDDRGGQDAGVVWVLFLDPDGTVRSAQEIGENVGGFNVLLDPNDNFGEALTGIGDLDSDGFEDFVVSAPGDDDGGVDRGALWVCFPDASGALRARTKISQTTGGFTGALCCGQVRFGKALARVGDLDGDGRDELAVSTDTEQLFVLFLNADGTVRSNPALPRPDGSTLQDGFGGSLAGPGDVDLDGVADLLVGAERQYRRSALFTLFLAADGSVQSTAKVSWSSGGFEGVTPEYAPLASALAALGDLDGDGELDLALGTCHPGHACFFGLDCFDKAGSAWVASLRPDGTLGAERRILEGTIGSGPFPGLDGLGSALANLGDLDGNGLGDLAIGAPFDDGLGSEQGAVWITFLEPASRLHAPAPAPRAPRPGGQPPPSTPPAFPRKLGNHSGGLTPPLHAYSYAGTAVARIGDLDDDGHTDLALGVPGADKGGTLEAGALRILFLNEHGEVQGSSEIPASFFSSSFFFGQLGWSLAALGDHDGDGVEDLAVGCPSANRAWILFLNPDGTPKGAVRISDALPPPIAGDFYNSYGAGLAALGDIDGDGVSDLALVDAGGPELEVQNVLFVVFLNADGTVKGYADHLFGIGGSFDDSVSCAAIGDLDGDGRAELAYGESLDNRVFVLFLEADGSIRSQKLIGGLSTGRFGSSLAGVGDVDGDGIEDLAVGAPGTDGFRGAYWLLHLDAQGNLRSKIEIRGPGGQASRLGLGDAFGSSLALLGDLDGDQVATLAAGARGDDGGRTDAGAVWLLDLP